MSDFLTRLKTAVRREVVELPVIGKITVMPLDDISFSIADGLRKKAYKEALGALKLDPENNVPFTDEEWTVDHVKMWGDGKRPETKAEYYAHNASLFDATKKLLHKMIYDDSGNPLIDSNDVEAVNAWVAYLNQNSTALNLLAGVYIKFVEERNEAFQKKSSEKQNETVLN